MSPLAPLIFDGHNDVLTRLLKAGGLDAADQFVTGRGGHIDVDKAKAGGFGGGFFAVWVPAADGGGPIYNDMTKPQYDRPLPPPIPADQAIEAVDTEIAILRRLEELGALTVCTDTAMIRACLAEGRMAAILHMEGAEAIGADLDALHVWHAAGLRSLGPVWSRPTVFGHGVPFRYPSSPDTGAGLTEAGKRLVRECNALRIMIDLSHLNEKGFDDVAAISDAPMVATHSNAHAITPSARNLTDRQLRVIRDSDGMVGLNYATVFLREDGRKSPFGGWDPILRHLDHLLGILGEDRVGLGSDFDGATMPDGIGDVTGQIRLLDALAAHGYGDALVKKIAHENWLALLQRTWGG